MAWRLASRLARFRAHEDAPPAADDQLFPAGVVALGRGGAGEIGALLRADGLYIGLLHLAADADFDTRTLDDLIEAIPTERCQILTFRYPVDPQRAAATWRANSRRNPGGAALARAISDDYLPTLIDAGWSDLRTYLTIEGDDPEMVLRDLYATAAQLPLAARAATLAEVKQIAGDWYTPRAQGLVTIGWSLTELTAEPPIGWATALLELPALTALPTMMTLHLEPIGSPAPISLELHRRLAAIDGEIEARRRAGRRSGQTDDDADDLLAERRELLATLAASGGEGDRPRLARLLIACAVEQEGARALRADIEAALHRCGFLATSFGPARSDAMLLSCAPLHAPQLGRGLMLTERGAALLAPVATAMPRDGGTAQREGGLPLGLRRDGAARYPLLGESILVLGDDDERLTQLQTWALGQIAAGTQLVIVDTEGSWHGIDRASGGERRQVALEIGALLADLGMAQLRRAEGESTRAIGGWADQLVRLFGDLCPDLGEDERGDLTATLMSLAEAEFAWGEPVQLGAIIEHLRASGTPQAQHLAALLTATGGHHPIDRRRHSDHSPVIYDATPEHDGQRGTAHAGTIAVALRAAIDHLAAWRDESKQARAILIDDLASLSWSSAAPSLIGALFEEAQARGIAIWCAASSLAAAPKPLIERLRILTPTVILYPDGGEATRLTARALGLSPAAVDQQRELTPGEVLLVRADEVTPLRTVPLRLPPYALRR